MNKLKQWLQTKKIATTGLLFQAGAGFQPIAAGANDIRQSSKLAQIYSGADLTSFIQGLFYFSLTVGAIIAVGRIMWAGYLYMGDSMWSKKQQATRILGEVVLGTLLLLGVWLILYTINPEILNLNILAPIQGSKAKGLQAQQQAGNLQGQATNAANCTWADPATGVCNVYNN